jgi:hypothetical protein
MVTVSHSTIPEGTLQQNRPKANAAEVANRANKAQREGSEGERQAWKEGRNPRSERQTVCLADSIPALN